MYALRYSHDQFRLDFRIQMGIYAALGIGQALGAFLNGLTLASIVYSASTRLHDVCLSGPLVFPYLGPNS
jgi:hypothetical protein